MITTSFIGKRFHSWGVEIGSETLLWPLVEVVNFSLKLWGLVFSKRLVFFSYWRGLGSESVTIPLSKSTVVPREYPPYSFLLSNTFPDSTDVAVSATLTQSPVCPKKLSKGQQPALLTKSCASWYCCVALSMKILETIRPWSRETLATKVWFAGLLAWI